MAHKVAAGKPECADLLFVLTRSCVNHSVVAYQALRSSAGLDPKKCCTAYCPMPPFPRCCVRVRAAGGSLLKGLVVSWASLECDGMGLVFRAGHRLR